MSFCATSNESRFAVSDAIILRASNIATSIVKVMVLVGEWINSAQSGRQHEYYTLRTNI